MRTLTAASPSSEGFIDEAIWRDDQSSSQPLSDRDESGPVTLPGLLIPTMDIEVVVRPAVEPSDEQVTYDFRGELELGGERFFIEQDGGTVFLRHAAWSLMGSGGDLFEAERDLRAEAAEIADVLLGTPTGLLDAETLALRDFVLRFA